MKGLDRPGRIAAVAIALVTAAWLFRAQIAQGLVIRGDDFLARNDAANAMKRYARAAAIDPESATAVDRLLFVLTQHRTRRSLRRAIETATAYLRVHPDDGTIRADRALCYLIERKYAPALPDFERAAKAMRDARYYAFAGWAASHAGDRRQARRLWASALAADPHFGAARRALERSK